MRKSMAGVLLVGFVVSLAFVGGAHAQAKKDEASGLDRIDGMIVDVNKEKSEISVRQSKTANLVWTVAYTPETKISFRNAPATLDTVQKDRHVICLGTFGSEKTRMTASRIDVRSDK